MSRKRNMKCFCGAKGEVHHACAEAWGLDYDPTSEQDAKEFLERRRRLIRELPGQQSDAPA